MFSGKDWNKNKHRIGSAAGAAQNKTASTRLNWVQVSPGHGFSPSAVVIQSVKWLKQSSRQNTASRLDC